MKITELTTLIREVIAEELAIINENKKKVAISNIQKLISENEIGEDDLYELSIFSKKPATDEELNVWLNGAPQFKAGLAKMDPDKANKWREFVKKEFPSNIKNKEQILNVKWDDTTKEWTKTSPPSSGGKLGFSENKK